MAGLIQREEHDTYFLTEVRQTKEVCNKAVTYEPALARKSGESILAFWPKTDMNNKSVNKDVYLKTLVQKMLQII